MKSKSMLTNGYGVSAYIDTTDWWLGYYRGPNHHYVCVLPTVVIRWKRRTEQGEPSNED